MIGNAFVFKRAARGCPRYFLLGRSLPAIGAAGAAAVTGQAPYVESCRVLSDSFVALFFFQKRIGERLRGDRGAFDASCSLAVFMGRTVQFTFIGSGGRGALRGVV